MRNGPYELVVAPPEYPGKRYRGRYCYEHHLVWWLHTGVLPQYGCDIHYKNGDRRDNQWANLEEKLKSKHSSDHHPGPMPLTHGTRTAYRRGCRCAECRDANRLAMARWRERHASKTP